MFNVSLLYLYMEYGTVAYMCIIFRYIKLSFVLEILRAICKFNVTAYFIERLNKHMAYHVDRWSKMDPTFGQYEDFITLFTHVTR